jgi:hypothetical protein
VDIGVRELGRSRRLQISDEPVWPQIAHSDLDDVAPRVHERIDAHCEWLPPQSLCRAAIHRDRGNFSDLAELEPQLPVGRDTRSDGVMENPVSIEAVLNARFGIGARSLPGDPGSGAPLRSG